MSAIVHRLLIGAALSAAVLIGPSELHGRDAPLVDVTMRHEIPADVTVRMFVRPGTEGLVVLVRAPLEAMRDIDFPVRGPGYLELDEVAPFLDDAANLWLADYLRVFEGGEDVGRGEVRVTRVSLPSNSAFSGFDEARRHLRAAAPSPEIDLLWSQAMLDVEIVFATTAPGEALTIEPAFAHLGLRTRTVLGFVFTDGSERRIQYVGDPGVVRLAPRWYHAAWQFLALGFDHILDGIDHLLFLLCLVIPVRKIGRLVAIVTSFTVAHSITLIASAMGLAPQALWFPPLIETLIALSIVYMAIENMVGAKTEHRWGIAFGFGLVHGFGFSFLLRESLQFAGSQLLSALLAFNIGVELGQLAVLVLLVPTLNWLFKRVPDVRMTTIILSALVGHTAWHWMTDRGSAFLEYDLRLSGVTGALLARWAVLAVVVAATAWALRATYRWLGSRWGEASRESESAATNR